MKNKLLIIFLVISLFLTGCWDNININRRAFVISMGIDKFVFDEEKDDPKLNNDLSRYRIAFSIPNLPKFVGQQGVSDEPKYTRVSVGTTITNAYKSLESRINKSIYFGHTKSLLFGEELLKDKVLLKQTMDALQRNSDFGKSIPVVAVEGSVVDALEVLPDTQPMVGIYIMELFENNKERRSFIEEKELGNLLQDFEENKTGLIPRLIVGEKDLKLEGAAIIKDYELQGWLDEKYLKGILWLLKKSYRLEISVPYHDYYIAYDVSDSETKIEFSGDSQDLSCKISIETEGSIDEYILDEEMFQAEEIRNLEKAVEKEIEKEVLDSIEILQKKYKTDVIEIGKRLERQKPEIWKEIKDNWDEVFENMDFTVDVKVYARRVGQTK
ncbi:MAG TPA: Ger(x)C family spore germination protein [Defluviitaleaceae bacterium]|nr:Ger(x)C family spore germination protein [Defluviitaleaceae bacterium]HPT75673.1 Ger(x)C family spore germination protein [Defluviitaleaceae bacterium]